MTTYWINAAGAQQPVVADGPHRIEQTAPAMGQQVFSTSLTTVGGQGATPAARDRDLGVAGREFVPPTIQLVPA